MNPKPAFMFAFSKPSCKTDDARCGRLPAPRVTRTLVQGLIWPFSLAHQHSDASYPVALLSMGRQRPNCRVVFGLGILVFARAPTRCHYRPRIGTTAPLALGWPQQNSAHAAVSARLRSKNVVRR